MAKKRPQSDISAEADMTPMIDMTFQLIAFFMVLIRFSEENQNQSIHLPASEHAQPAKEDDQACTLLLQVENDNSLSFYPEPKKYPIASKETPARLKKELTMALEKDRVKRGADQPRLVKEVKVIIRSDESAESGAVQELMKICQIDLKLENYALRAMRGKFAPPLEHERGKK